MGILWLTIKHGRPDNFFMTSFYTERWRESYSNIYFEVLWIALGKRGSGVSDLPWRRGILVCLASLKGEWETGEQEEFREKLCFWDFFWCLHLEVSFSSPNLPTTEYSPDHSLTINFSVWLVGADTLPCECQTLFLLILSNYSSPSDFDGQYWDPRGILWRSPAFSHCVVVSPF